MNKQLSKTIDVDRLIIIMKSAYKLANKHCNFTPAGMANLMVFCVYLLASNTKTNMLRELKKSNEQKS